jgi:class 3 adenylate cyclase/tetratricopeptide (TPR) repeat protein
MPDQTLMELLASYVPKLIQKRAYQNPTPIAEPLRDNFQSVVLFADISGFTALTERLAEKGPVGAESLARILNDYFGKMIDVIHEYSGDVVKFAGDALIVVWPIASDLGTPGLASEELKRQRTLHVLECSLKIREKMLDYKADGSPLYLKMALATGGITEVHVGGVFNRWEFVLVGNPLVELGFVNNEAKAGDILISPSALKLIKNDIDVDEFALDMNGTKQKAARLKKLKGSIQPPVKEEAILITDELKAPLSPYIPGAVINRIAAGQSDWLAELRTVTIVFINVLETEQTLTLEASQELMRMVQRVVYRFEGSLNKISQDDKGIMIDTAFGLPPLAHEDDPLRGVQAAMTIRDELKKMGIHSSMGITTGRVFCGLVGNEVRRVYTFLGNPVNLAARLMVLGNAQKEVVEREGIAIMCDRPTYEAANDDVEFETLPPQHVKGRSEAVDIFHPLYTKKTVPRQRMRLIGRQVEKAILINSFLELQRGSEMQTIIMQGEAGIGKSQLIAELMSQAETSQIKTLVAEGDAIEKNSPYHAWRSTFNRVFGIEETLRKPQLSESDRESIRESVFAKLTEIDSDLLRYAPLLTALLPVHIPENDFTSELTGETRGGNIRELLTRILQYEAGQAALLIIVEDLHWVDSASWIFLTDVYQKVRPLMLVLTTRPLSEPVPQEYRLIRENSSTQFVKLETMDLDDVDALVCQRLGVVSIPPVVSKMIREKSEGHPFFAEELAYALRDSGVLLIEGETSRLASGSDDLADVVLPDNLQAAITSRIDGLSPSEQLTLKVASVIGRIFAYRVLEAIYPIEADKPEMREYMDAFTRLSLTLVESETPDLAYIFKHAVTQEASYNLMLFSQRRQLHRAVAEWIEEHHQDDIESFYTLLAYHWYQAASTPDAGTDLAIFEKAREFLEKAGNLALSNFANTESIEFYTELLALTDTDQVSKLYLGKLYRKMGDAYLGLGKLAEAKEYIVKAMAALGLPLPSSDLGLVGGVLKHVAIQTSHRLRPDHYRELDLSPEEEQRRFEILVLTEKLVVVQFLNGDPNPLPMLFGVMAGLNTGETMRKTPEAWALYATTSAVADFIPLHSQAKHYKETWFEMGKEFDDPNAFVDGAIALCTVASGNGEWQEVKDLIEKSSAICEELGDHRRNAESVAYIAVNALMEGGPKLAEVYNKREWEIALRRENPIHIAFAYQVDCSAMVWKGEYDDCIANAQKLLALSEKSWVGEYPEYIVRTAMWLAQWLKGERDGVWETAKTALDKFSKGTAADFSAHLIDLHLAELVFQALEEGREKDWPREQMIEIEKYAKLAIKNIKKAFGVFSIGGPALNRFSGNLAWHQGKQDKALQFWRTAIEKAHAFPMKYEEARSSLELGRHLEKGNPERTASLEKAEALFTECGLENWASIARAEKSR